MNTGFNLEFWIILGIAFLLLASGVGLYLRLIKRSNPKLFYSSVIISWVLISMFPVVLLFSVFQDSSLTGEFTDTSFGTITVGGAFGAFFVIWIVGTRNTLKAIKADHSEETIKSLNDQIANLQGQFKALDEKPKDTRIITESKKIKYRFKTGMKSRVLGLVTGDIQQVRDIDLWVNSENTNLQMARFYDSSISGLIRYLGAEKDPEGNVIDDIIFNELHEPFKKAGNQFPAVKPGLAFRTGSGKLKFTHNVQGIIHVTTVYGEVGQGYTSIKNLGVCVQNALLKADEFAADNKKKRISILFPLFGTGTARGDVGSAAQKLFDAVLDYFGTTPDSKVEEVYFLTWKFYERDLCKGLLDEKETLALEDPTQKLVS